MKQCLICLAILEEQLNFMDLLLLKRKENDICQECLNSFEDCAKIVNTGRKED